MMFSILGLGQYNPSRQGWKPFSGDWSIKGDVGQGTKDWLSEAGKVTYDATVGAPATISDWATGGEKTGDIISPTHGVEYDEWGNPVQGFSTAIDNASTIAPPNARPYVAPAMGAAIGLFNPWLGATFNTAYGAGKAQEAGTFDWNTLGREAAKNYGTAALTVGAKELLNGANSAQSAQASGNTMKQGFDAAQALPSTSGNTMSAGYNAAMQPGSSLGAKALGAFDTSVDVARASAGIPQISNTSATAPTTSPTFGDQAYRGAVEAGKGIGTEALAQTLAPKQATALSGFDAAQGVGGEATDGYQFGDQLRAFGDPSMYTGDNIITPEQLGDLTMKVGYNNYQQVGSTMDQFNPAGQYAPQENTPLEGQLSNINRSTEKAYQDLLREVDNNNAIARIKGANPDMSDEELNGYLMNPDTQPLINGVNYFQGLKPLTGFNTSTIR